ncbi:hypothetical protein [uncultured Phocaeicola sp.]|uniref:hypothetical protein n=1 Tax=uncultured Phocaeicola sp. TaxID=990718 RepID=UPI0025F38083|nr:hypothetical protein [uncultured Phocaeicola sp.]
MTILLVDSDKRALDREAQRLSRRQSGIVVVLHSSAADAEKFAMHHDVDIVYVREKLDEMSGQELVRRILRFRPTAECHVLGPEEDIPFAGASCREWDPFETEANEFDSPQEENTMVGALVNRMEAKPLGRHYSFAKTEREGDLPMTEHELRGLGRRQLLELMLEQGKEMESSKAAYEKDLDFLKAEHERDLEYLKAEHEKETSQLKKELEQAKAAMKEQENSVNEAELEAQKSQFEQTVESLKAQHQQDLDALREEHKEETAHLREELEQAKKSLEKREIALNEAGSIAVAALQINGVFEAAQAASQQYIENIRSLSDRQAAICAQRDVENRVEVERKLKEAEEKCAAMEYASKRKCEAMEQEAKQKSEAYWTEVSRRLQSFYENHRELKRLLDFGTPGAQF